MGLSIRDRAETIGTFRYVSVHLMETLARWVPTTPELEVKVLFGRHIWEFAQHADALGRRTAELRAPLHFSLRPVEAYAGVLDEVAAIGGTAERVQLLYEVIIPDLDRRYRRYLSETNQLLDDPSVRVIERILTDFPRLRSDAAATMKERLEVRLADTGQPGRVASRLSAIETFVAFRPAPVTEGV